VSKQRIEGKTIHARGNRNSARFLSLWIIIGGGFMDQEYFFLMLGIASACVFAALLVSLLVSRKTASRYRRFLQNQKESLDVLSIIKQKALLSSAQTSPPVDERAELDAALRDKYAIIREINGGAMSRVYLVKNRTLENQWI
jgi:hypothetical protein